MEQKYTKPTLRARIVSSVKSGSAGGNPNSWSARKSQIVAKRYKAAGGGYIGGPSKPQKSLKKWTGEKWGNSSKAVVQKVKKTGIVARYLPAKAWTKLSSSQVGATNRKKISASKAGKQYISNTKAARSAGKSVRDS